jgi:dephospho-CoA kinase
MIIVGLTGNLASGKSEAAKYFRKNGAQVVDADAIARKITRKGTPLFEAIIKIFGKEFKGKSGQLDRRKLAQRVFSHPKDLKKLNVLVHPGVILETYKRIEKMRSKKGLLILDVPLLFESRMEKLADFTVVLKASEASMVSRASRRNIPSDLARKILAVQWPIMKKARLADFIIDNNGTSKELERQVGDVIKKIFKEQVTRESSMLPAEFGRLQSPLLRNSIRR